MTPRQVAPAESAPEVFYPESDGLPMAENTLQFLWITVLAGNLAALFRGADDVFVCGNQFWYPVQGQPGIVQAPDVYVVFGRPKGHRPSWRQWEEADTPMTVVFEVLSPSNTPAVMREKHRFYQQHGVEEYYAYDPDEDVLEVFLRDGPALARRHLDGHFASPRLGITFDLTGDTLRVFYPDGRPFLSFEDLADARDRAELQAAAAQQAVVGAQQQVTVAHQQVTVAHQAAVAAQQAALAAEQAAGETLRLATRLAELSRLARRGLASAEELAELEHLEAELDPPG